MKRTCSTTWILNLLKILKKHPIRYILCGVKPVSIAWNSLWNTKNHPHTKKMNNLRKREVNCEKICKRCSKAFQTIDLGINAKLVSVDKPSNAKMHSHYLRGHNIPQRLMFTVDISITWLRIKRSKKKKLYAQQFSVTNTLHSGKRKQYMSTASSLF